MSISVEYHRPLIWCLGRLFSEVAALLAMAVSARRSVSAQAVGDNLHVSTVGELSGSTTTAQAATTWCGLPKRGCGAEAGQRLGTRGLRPSLPRVPDLASAMAGSQRCSAVERLANLFGDDLLFPWLLLPGTTPPDASSPWWLLPLRGLPRPSRGMHA
ncbi:hypothetical protein GW17_00032447 [Ensete ventricosum]|nr:hypothetical protein GW17_00032447 [Ensete ventricosum]